MEVDHRAADVSLPSIDRVAIAHDYLTQRGGAERVVLSLSRAFPQAPLYTSFYEPADTFPEFANADVRTSPLQRASALRRHHRLALPLLAPAFSRMRIDADLAVCSSSGWAHGAHVSRRKIVYCHAPARWLYQTERYLADASLATRAAFAALRPPLERWDRAAAASAHRYLANSSWTAAEIERVYGIEADVIHPPIGIDPDGPRQEIGGVEPGYVLCVSRLLPYKNVDAIVDAFAQLPAERLVVAGDGPTLERLRALAGPNVRLPGRVEEPELRWLYENARCLVSASYEDFGLTPIEAAAFGKPTSALRFGGFLDTIREGDTGVLFDNPRPDDVARAVRALLDNEWDGNTLREHARLFSEERFIGRIRAVVEDELGR